MNERQDRPRYPALRAIAAFFKGIAWVLLVIELAAIWLTPVPSTFYAAAFVGRLALTLFAVVGFVLMLAIAEGIRVVIDNEENTRITYEKMEQVRELLARMDVHLRQMNALFREISGAPEEREGERSE